MTSGHRRLGGTRGEGRRPGDTTGSAAAAKSGRSVTAYVRVETDQVAMEYLHVALPESPS